VCVGVGRAAEFTEELCSPCFRDFQRVSDSLGSAAVYRACVSYDDGEHCDVTPSLTVELPHEGIMLVTFLV